ncbi:hypothetical protein Hdeb2414_s0028g00699941 [Helianthus debilis subsp. tardiflorus]
MEIGSKVGLGGRLQGNTRIFPNNQVCVLVCEKSRSKKRLDGWVKIVEKLSSF